MKTYSLLILAFFVGIHSSSVHGDDEENETSCGFVGGMDSESAAARIEHEAKILVPDDQVEKFYEFISTHFKTGSPFLSKLNPNYSTSTAEEFFTDDYYDTPQMQIDKIKGGIRHRSRENPGNVADRKNGRELIQIKLSNDRLHMSEARTEVKFRVTNASLREKCIAELPEKDRTQVQEWDDHPLLSLVLETQRVPFFNMVKEIGINPLDLKKKVTIKQRRRRVYFKEGATPIFTITLDETSTTKLWKKFNFTEVETEINEVAFTIGDAHRREELLALSKTLQAELFKAFPMIKVDQTPKYSKMLEIMTEHRKGDLAFAMLVDHQSAIAPALIGILLVAGVGLAWLMTRRSHKSN